MRRLIPITALVWILALPIWAQRGGGHFGSASHGGFSRAGAGAGSHFSSSHPGIAHSFTRAPNASRGPFLRDRFRSDEFHRRGHRFGFRNRCYGYPCGVGYGYPWWGYDPWLWDWWDDSSNYDDDYYRNLQIANAMNQESLAEQRMLRQEEADGDQDIYASRQPVTLAQQGSAGDRVDPVIPATVLVFRDRHTEEIRNYAIVGETLWNFSGQRTRKVPLSELDLPATEKANEDRGVIFRVPTISQGQ